jgi:2',3'-cyclic-nucleotide 2'-phosphodiesterase (5'-nucleotidase family)
MDMVRCGVSVLVGLVVALPVGAETKQERTEPTRLTVLFTSDLHGHLVDQGCEATVSRSEPMLPFVAQVVAAERDRAAREGALPPLLLDGGDAFFPSPLVGDLASESDRARELLSAMVATGYDALTLGDTTASAPWPAVTGLLRAARQQGLPVVSANIRCLRETAASDCRETLAGLTRPSAILRRGPVRIGVFGLLPEDLGERVARQNVRGVEIFSAADAARRTVLRLRDEGAHVVVLLSQVDRAATAPRRTLELISRLEGDAQPDLVIAATTTGLALPIRLAAGGPPVVTVRANAVGRVVLAEQDGAWHVSHGETVQPGGARHSIVGALVDSWNAVHCESHARPVPGGELIGAMDEEDFLHLVLRVLREQTQADIAVIHRGVVGDGRLFPLLGVITHDHVRRLLPYDNVVRVATVEAKKLPALANRFRDNDQAIQSGLEQRGSSWRINGRDQEPESRYRLVTVDFVAEGGGGIIGANGPTFESVPPDGRGGVLLAQRVVNWLRSQREELYDPELRLDLYTSPLWTAAYSLDVGVSDVVVTGSHGGYEQPQLQRQELFDLRVGGEFRGGVSTRDHRWANAVTLRYGRQRLESSVGSNEHSWSESTDLIQFRSAYVFDYVRNRLLAGEWYGPSLFLEYQFESEFHHRGDGSHYLEMTGTGGVELKPLKWLTLLAGLGLRSIVLGDESRPVPGLNLRTEVLRRRFFGLPDSPVHLAGFVDYFLLWPSAGTTHKLSVEGKLEVTLAGPIRLNATVRAFLYDEPGGPVAMAVDSTLGIGIARSHRLQRF